MAKKTYIRPELKSQDLHVFKGPWTKAPPSELVALDKLRALYLVSRHLDVVPVATRITSALDRRPGDWQKAVQFSAPVWEQNSLEGAWYFLCHVVHSSVFTIELEVLCPDGNPRIALVEGIKIPSEAKLGLFLLPKGNDATCGSSYEHQRTAAH